MVRPIPVSIDGLNENWPERFNTSDFENPEVASWVDEIRTSMNLSLATPQWSKEEILEVESKMTELKKRDPQHYAENGEYQQLMRRITMWRNGKESLDPQGGSMAA